MATHARLTSLEALDHFRADLIVFMNKAHAALDQALDEVRRTRSWIQNDQRSHWENEIRRRARNLAQAEQELLSARMTKALDNLTTQQAAVNKARHALEEAREKMRKVKLWIRDYDGIIEPMARGLTSLRGYLEHDMPQAVALIAELAKIMEGYTEATTPKTAPTSRQAPAVPEPEEVETP